LRIEPVTLKRWADLERFFEANGNPNYCWCQRWRAASSEFQTLGQAGRKKRLHDLVKAKTPIGLLAYRDDEVIGWCSVAPRETYTAVERSRVLPRAEGEDVWAVVCFFVGRGERGSGLPAELLKAAATYAKQKGARLVEGYPVLEGSASYRWMGRLAEFEKAGFRVVGEASGGRTPVQRILTKGSATA
jgi:GNAT superfamily N-acetyltransferase